jgi:hypothetical protein
MNAAKQIYWAITQFPEQRSQQLWVFDAIHTILYPFTR